MSCFKCSCFGDSPTRISSPQNQGLSRIMALTLADGLRISLERLATDRRRPTKSRLGNRRQKFVAEAPVRHLGGVQNLVILATDVEPRSHYRG